MHSETLQCVSIFALRVFLFSLSLFLLTHFFYSHLSAMLIFITATLVLRMRRTMFELCISFWWVASVLFFVLYPKRRQFYMLVSYSSYIKVHFFLICCSICMRPHIIESSHNLLAKLNGSSNSSEPMRCAQNVIQCVILDAKKLCSEWQRSRTKKSKHIHTKTIATGQDVPNHMCISPSIKLFPIIACSGSNSSYYSGR